MLVSEVTVSIAVHFNYSVSHFFRVFEAVPVPFAPRSPNRSQFLQTAAVGRRMSNSIATMMKRIFALLALLACASAFVPTGTSAGI
jgi:hypothetical protein